MQKRKLWQIPFSQRQQRLAGQTIAITSFHPFLYSLLINQGFFSALAGQPIIGKSQAPSEILLPPWQGSTHSHHRVPAWLDLTWQVGRASPQLSPQLPRHVAIIIAAKMKSQWDQILVSICFSHSQFTVFHIKSVTTPSYFEQDTVARGSVADCNSSPPRWLALYSACALFLPRCLSSCPDWFREETSPR